MTLVCILVITASENKHGRSVQDTMKINLIKFKRSSAAQLGAALTSLKSKICKKYAQMAQLRELDATLSENILQYYIAR
jgi:hypothetical protein